jgi:hypothetical protein
LRNPAIDVLNRATAVILDPDASPEEKQIAIADVKATGDQECIEALFRTISHERRHKAQHGHS